MLRRDFLRFLGLTAASAALPALAAPETIEDVVDRVNATGKDLWLSFVGPSGEMRVNDGESEWRSVAPYYPVTGHIADRDARWRSEYVGDWSAYEDRSNDIWNAHALGIPQRHADETADAFHERVSFHRAIVEARNNEGASPWFNTERSSDFWAELQRNAEDHVAVLPEGTTLRVESWTENAHGIARVEWPSRVHYVGDDLTPEQEAELDLWLETQT